MSRITTGLFDDPGAVLLENSRGEICFRDVSFAYPDDRNRVFRKLNLAIHPRVNIPA